MNNLERIPVPDVPRDIVLIVEDIGEWVWNFSDGKRSFAAMIKDTAWLEDFHLGLHSVKSGDELRVKVKTIYESDETEMLMLNGEEIVQVVGVVTSQDDLPGLFDQ